MAQNQNLVTFANNITAANSTGLYYSGVVNATSYTVGTSTVANSTGVYTGTVNASAVTVGTNFVANTTGVYTNVSLTPISTTTPGLIITNAAEPSTISATAANGTINFDSITQSVLYYTSSAANNWTLNIRGNSSTSLSGMMTTNQTITVAFLVTQGATAYYANAHTIDGTSVTPKWQGGSAPTAGNASGIDIYTYTVIKTAANTFTRSEEHTSELQSH